MKAVKFDKEKPKLGLIPPKAIFSIGDALTFGAKKYSSFNYKRGNGLDWDQYYNALLRHLMAWIDGEDNDPESKLNHLDHMGACAVMLIDAVKSDIGRDTRFKGDNNISD